MQALERLFLVFFVLVKLNGVWTCRSNTYAVNSTSCADCPANTVSPAYSESVMECTPKPGYYGWPGQAAAECDWNFFCPQGVSRPAGCPDGTRADPGMSRCVPGSKNVILYDWITGVTWVTLVLVFIVFIGCYRHALFADIKADTTKIYVKVEL